MDKRRKRRGKQEWEGLGHFPGAVGNGLGPLEFDCRLITRYTLSRLLPLLKNFIRLPPKMARRRLLGRQRHHHRPARPPLLVISSCTLAASWPAAASALRLAEPEESCWSFASPEAPRASRSTSARSRARSRSDWRWISLISAAAALALTAEGVVVVVVVVVVMVVMVELLLPLIMPVLLLQAPATLRA